MTNTHISNANNQAGGLTTLNVSPSTVGNVIVLNIFASSFLGTVTSVTGGGCTWAFAESGNSSASHYETWFGTVNTTGPSTITITYSGSATHACELNADEYHSDIATAWSLVDQNFVVGAATTTPTGPPVTASAVGQIVHDYFRGTSLSAGSTSGFSYEITGNGGGIAYNLNTASGTIYTPAMNSSNATYASIAVIIAPASGAVSVAFGATGTLAAVGVPTLKATVAFGATGTLAATGTPTLKASVAFGATGTLAAVGVPTLKATVPFGATGTLAAAGTPTITKSVPFGATGTLAAHATPTLTASVAFTATGTLRALQAASSVQFGAVGTLRAVGGTGNRWLYGRPLAGMEHTHVN